MKSKNEVYVRIKSEKKKEKVFELLKMFGEKTGSTTEDIFPSDNYVLKFYDGNVWYGISECDDRVSQSEKVTVSELKQILFREHAKEGGVVIVDNGECGSRWVVELTGNDVASFEHSNSFDLKVGENDFYKFGNSIMGGKFIRYATEEEKALLNPVKELEVGKWYKHANGEHHKWLVYLGKDNTYGFGASGRWDDDVYNQWIDYLKEYSFEEATPEEVEQALIKEAEKRYGKDWKTVKIKEHADGVDGDINVGGYATGVLLWGNVVWNNNGMLFHNGKWAEKLPTLECEFVINGDKIKTCLDRVKDKMDKFKVFSSITDKDISIIESLHDTLLENYGYSLHSSILEEVRQLAEKLRKLL